MKRMTGAERLGAITLAVVLAVCVAVSALWRAGGTPACELPRPGEEAIVAPAPTVADTVSRRSRVTAGKSKRGGPGKRGTVPVSRRPLDEPVSR